MRTAFVSKFAARKFFCKKYELQIQGIQVNVICRWDPAQYFKPLRKTYSSKHTQLGQEFTGSVFIRGVFNFPVLTQIGFRRDLRSTNL
jgi:hypothetical protein